MSVNEVRELNANELDEVAGAIFGAWFNAVKRWVYNGGEPDCPDKPPVSPQVRIPPGCPQP
jgi:hypothetical protein